jgi:hypothetical protein
LGFADTVRSTHSKKGAMDREEFRHLNTSSMKATLASESMPVVLRRYESCSRAFKETGPKSSSGVEVRVSCTRK